MMQFPFHSLISVLVVLELGTKTHQSWDLPKVLKSSGWNKGPNAIFLSALESGVHRLMFAQRSYPSMFGTRNQDGSSWSFYSVFPSRKMTFSQGKGGVLAFHLGSTQFLSCFAVTLMHTKVFGQHLKMCHFVPCYGSLKGKHSTSPYPHTQINIKLLLHH